MNIYASSHPGYFSITPGISIGKGWIVIDWMWWVVGGGYNDIFPAVRYGLHLLTSYCI